MTLDDVAKVLLITLLTTIGPEGSPTSMRINIDWKSFQGLQLILWICGNSDGFNYPIWLMFSQLEPIDVLIQWKKTKSIRECAKQTDDFHDENVLLILWERLWRTFGVIGIPEHRQYDFRQLLAKVLKNWIIQIKIWLILIHFQLKYSNKFKFLVKQMLVSKLHLLLLFHWLLKLLIRKQISNTNFLFD